MPQITEATIAMFKDKLSKGQHINSTCNEEKQLVFAWEELTQLRARVLELEAERNEWKSRCERRVADIACQATRHEELAEVARSRIAELEKERDAAREEVEATRCDLNMTLRESARLREQLAAQQLVIEKMRSSLVATRDDLELRMKLSEDDSLNISNSILDQMLDAIDLQPSTEALDAYVAEAVKAEREACAKVCDGYSGIHQKEMISDLSKRLSAAIRARSNKENKE